MNTGIKERLLVNPVLDLATAVTIFSAALYGHTVLYITSYWRHFGISLSEIKVDIVNLMPEHFIVFLGSLSPILSIPLLIVSRNSMIAAYREYTHPVRTPFVLRRTSFVNASTFIAAPISTLLFPCAMIYYEMYLLGIMSLFIGLMSIFVISRYVKKRKRFKHPISHYVLLSASISMVFPLQYGESRSLMVKSGQISNHVILKDYKNVPAEMNNKELPLIYSDDEKMIVLKSKEDPEVVIIFIEKDRSSVRLRK